MDAFCTFFYKHGWIGLFCVVSFFLQEKFDKAYYIPAYVRCSHFISDRLDRSIFLIEAKFEGFRSGVVIRKYETVLKLIDILLLHPATRKLEI